MNGINVEVGRFDAFIAQCELAFQEQVNSLIRSWKEILREPSNWQRLKAGEVVSIQLLDQTLDVKVVQGACAAFNAPDGGWCVRHDGGQTTTGGRAYARGAISFVGRRFAKITARSKRCSRPQKLLRKACSHLSNSKGKTNVI